LFKSGNAAWRTIKASASVKADRLQPGWRTAHNKCHRTGYLREGWISKAAYLSGAAAGVKAPHRGVGGRLVADATSL
jgi:hypothetical protein